MKPKELEDVSPSKRPSRAAGRAAVEKAVQAAHTWQIPRAEEEPPKEDKKRMKQDEHKEHQEYQEYQEKDISNSLPPPEGRETRLLTDAIDRPEPLGDFANKHIRVGEDYQAAVLPSAEAAQASEERGDELIHVSYTPLTAPPAMPEIPDLSAMNAAAAAAKAKSAAEAPRKVTTVTEDVELDDEGLPVLPEGVERNELCTAYGTNAGERKQYKAILLSVRSIFPPLLVKYVGDLQGRTGSLILPDVRTSFVNLSDVSPWVPPEERPPEASGSGEEDGEGVAAGMDAMGSSRDGPGGGRRGGRVLPARQARHVKPALQLLSEAGGLRLHLDPRRDTEGYAGTGYRGVNDYWHTGYKKEHLSLSTTGASIRVATQRWSRQRCTLEWIWGCRRCHCRHDGPQPAAGGSGSKRVSPEAGHGAE